MTHKNIFIISASKIYKGNSASSSRLMNIAKSLVLANDTIYLCSAENDKNVELHQIREIDTNIFSIGEENIVRKTGSILFTKLIYKFIYILSIVNYLRKIKLIMNRIKGEKIIYLYPGIFITIEIACLILLKLISHYKIYYDLNEIRRAGLYNNTYSNKFIKRQIQRSTFLFNWIKYYLNEKLLFFYDGIIVISTNLENYSKKYNKNLLRVPILSNTIEKPFLKAPIFKTNQIFLICFTGLINIKKEGFELLFKVISEINKFHHTELHLFGTIANYDKDLILNIFPQKLGISGVIKYFGMVDQEDLLNEMQKRHLLILPRPLNMQTKYGFSTKLSEYLISGVPTLVTNVSDNNLFIKDNINGFIVKPGDFEAMTKKILYIIKNYNSIAPGIVENAYKTASQYFNYTNFYKEIDNFLL